MHLLKIRVVVKKIKCGLLRVQIPHMTLLLPFVPIMLLLLPSSRFIRRKVEVNFDITYAQKKKDEPITQSLGYVPQLERYHSQDRHILFSPSPLSLSIFSEFGPLSLNLLSLCWFFSPPLQSFNLGSLIET